MVTQQRALRTRRAVVHAVAAQIDRYGYDGTSLLSVCRAAGISMGALTFHFPAKDKLADALEQHGREVTQAAVEQVLAIPASPLRRARTLVLTMARLLEKDTEVRAAARLARERPSTDADWAAIWLPGLRELLHQAHAEGQLRTTADPETVTVMVSYLIVGIDAHLRHRAHAPVPNSVRPDAAEQLARVWDLILYGVSAASGPPQGTPQEDGAQSPGLAL